MSFFIGQQVYVNDGRRTPFTAAEIVTITHCGFCDVECIEHYIVQTADGKISMHSGDSFLTPFDETDRVAALVACDEQERRKKERVCRAACVLFVGVNLLLAMTTVDTW